MPIRLRARRRESIGDFRTPRSFLVQNGFHETLPGDEVQGVVVDFFQGK